MRTHDTSSAGLDQRCGHRLTRTLLATGLVVAGLVAGCFPSVREADSSTLLWPDGAPHARGRLARDRPELHYFLPSKERSNGRAVVVASGGSYGHHGGLRSEGVSTAQWLASQGFTAVLVRYRVNGGHGYDHADFFADGKRAVRTVRAQAEQLDIDPHDIGFFGFSAGGHLGSMLATRCPADAGEPRPHDEIDGASCAIAYSVLVYPVITLYDDHAHRRSRRNLLGWGAKRDPTLVEQLSTHTQVTPHTAPTFLVHSRNDRKVDVENSILFHEALRERGVPTELVVAEDGAHGVGLANDPRRMPQMSTWPARWQAWLAELPAR